MTSGPPYLLALLFGLAVSATLYMIFVWPKVEPEDDAQEVTDDDAPGTSGVPEEF